jgi:CRP/FNR family transcriptional regulator, cyclic AMP receptor protein
VAPFSLEPFSYLRSQLVGFTMHVIIAARSAGRRRAFRRPPTLDALRRRDSRAGGGGIMADNAKRPSIDWGEYLSRVPQARAVEYGASRTIFREGDPANSVFFLRRGQVKLTVTSRQGKEAIISLLNGGDFFGEGCLAGQPLRMATAVALTDCSLARLERGLMAELLHARHEISEMFVGHLLTRNIRYEADLVDHLFNSSEKRLARVLLLLSHFGKESKSEPVLPRVTQENLAEMVGTTRSRVSHFMNKFRAHGFIDYGESGGLRVNSGLLSVVLRE